ncbi:hypothetical protein H5410_054401 [Solanum commersonii]|uniref:TIR domain-containing protein n=1 Tax=Solanum commersonii TaxID=4109 RepID=A0A9J5WEU0_SOLCO|nr:hypothetical protein H5410_054401 [Solanum commersonii]
MASSSSSIANDSQYCPRWKYDVFLSFRGEDTRRTFTGHLYEGLKNRGIFTFQDDKRLEHGDSIPEELLKAIEESQVTLIVFSRNYATSRWCVNELVKIMECKEEENGQTVIPIFYDVDPSHVRYQSESFAEAFAKHEVRYQDDVEGMQKVQGWRTALTAVANLKGYDIRDGIESEKIQLIVHHISSKFCKSAHSLSFLQDVVGINAHFGETKIPTSNRSQWCSDCRDLGNRRNDYVNNKYDGKCMIPSKLCSMKVLIVLDDIDHGDHLEYLADDVMAAKLLHAFKKEVPNECCKKLSLEVVNQAKGLPLALKVWGSLLHKKDLIQWRRTVDQIKKNSNSEIVEKLKISYDGLEPEEQKIFLDIACFFRGHKRKEVMQIVDSCDFGAEY